jgi:hypothetical protein
VVSPNTQTDGLPKVPKGCSEGLCHFWHLITLEQFAMQMVHMASCTA